MDKWILGHNQMLSNAIKLAADAHKGQSDKAGQPYIFHCLAVMDAVEVPKEKIAAVLHDTVEDTVVTLHLIQTIFGDEIAEVVDALSRREEESWSSYVQRVKENLTAVNVKIADLKHNTDPERFVAATRNGHDVSKVFGMYQKTLVELMNFRDGYDG